MDNDRPHAITDAITENHRKRAASHACDASMIQAKRVGVCAGMLLVSAVAVLFLRYPARIEDEEPVPFKIIGLGEKGLQSWTSPPFGPGIDCHHEMHNDDSSCEIVRLGELDPP